MNTAIRRALIVLLVATAAPSFVAQVARPGREGRPLQPPEPGVSPAEVQRMFDAYALMQAQEQLKISDEQFARFMPRFKALQEARRKTQSDRTQVIIELRRLASATSPDEAQIKEKLRALQDVDGRTAGDLKKSYESIDEVLNVKQQAQFRVFEEVMERRKLDMISRARANRPRPKAQ